MTEVQKTGLQMRAVTVSREYGSGGGEIAQRLAARLDWKLIDHEIVVQVAHEVGISEAEAEAYDEHVDGTISRILASMQAINATVLVTTPVPDAYFYQDTLAYHEAVRRVVEASAALGRMVIVGRGGQMLLHKRRDMLHVRIIAPLEERVRYVMRREALDRAPALARIQVKDHDRMRYLQERYHRRPDDPLLYDLTVNTGILDLDSAVEIIYLALQRKAALLSLPTEDLGPGMGLPRYPGEPGDFRPPEAR